jgi:hypothetical protein
MKKYLVIVFGMILFGGCEPKCQDDPNLTADELSWLPNTNGQLIIFKNDSGLVDTFIVNRSFESSVGQTDGNGCTHSFQTGYNDIGSAFRILVSHYNQWNIGNINSASLNGFKFSNYTPQNNVIINGISYNNVYILDFGTYYTRQNGILQFDNPIGTHWVKIN